VLSAKVQRSIDGGKTCSKITGTHGDYHDFWINPNNSKNMIIANDGGAVVSSNRSSTLGSSKKEPIALSFLFQI
jgi:hypothetical protein